MWLLYLLIALCVLACTFRDICSIATCAVVLGFTGLGAILEFFGIHKHGFFRFLGVMLFAGLIALEFRDPAGYQTFLFHLCLDVIWALLGYRALSHSKTTERVQIGVLTIIPLVCLAIDMPALEFLAFLAVYFSILFGFLIRQSMVEPTTGSLGFVSGRVQGIVISRGQFWRTIAFLALIAFGVGGLLFLLVPRWGADAPVPGLEQPRGSFPDVALDKTGKINLDTSLMFRANVPIHPEGYYWRIDVQDAFDGTNWRSLSATVRHAGDISMSSELPYTLEFVREWRDYRIPSIEGTIRISKLPDAQDSEVRFYEDSLGLWRRWGWKRGEPLMGYQFYLDDAKKEGTRRQHYLLSHFGELFAFIGGRDLFKQVPDMASQPRMIWPSKRREPLSWLRLAKMAQDIVGDASNNREKADRIRDYLKTHYQYSLERPPREGSIVEDFLFRQKFGHCEVFSTTMAVLLAILNVPVHNVTGFVSSEFRDGYNHVRSAHAHSWVEVYTDNHWEIYDPTPSGAQQVQVNWLIRIDDWFASYQPRDLYLWVKSHIALFGSGLAILVLLCILAMRLMKWFRRRMMPTHDVWRLAWHELQNANPNSNLGKLISSRSLEDWWHKDCPENPELQAFARNYIQNLYREVQGGSLHRFAAFKENCRIWRNAGRLLRGKK